MFFLVLLLLAYTNVVYVTKIEDMFTCINDTDCSESTDSIIYTQSPNVDNPVLEDSLNDTEEDNLYTTINPSETSSRTNLNVTEQSEPQSTSTISSPIITMPLNNDKILTLEEKEICECDLTKFSCDINCCCDIDCNQFHLSAFSHCQDHHVKLYDSRYCYNRNFIQRNNTPFILEKLGNNLFCILYDNIPSKYSVGNDLMLQNEKDLWKVLEMKKYKWRMKSDEISPKYNLSKYYQHEDFLWKLNNKSIESIEFLQSGFTGFCSFKKFLRYLENWKGTCIQNELTGVNRYLFPITFSNFTVINSLPLFNKTLIAKKECPSNICLTVRSHYCLNSFSACNRTKILSFCTGSTCINIVKGLKYVIGHNGSAGVNSIDAYFNIGNASHAFHQYFEVHYDWIDGNKTKVFTRSGNPGYMIGKPIIIGTPTNGSDAILFNRTDGFLTLPLAKKNGECDQIDRYIIAFGEDIKLRCSARLFVKNFTALSCAELQNLTMSFLIKDSVLNVSRHYVSKQGNFTSKHTTDWLRIAFDRIPRSVVTAHTTGEEILCSGLVTSMHLDVVYSTLSKPKIVTNYKILGIGITFNKEEDISWPKCTLKNCTDILYVDIVSHVNFHDVSKPSKYRFVGGPNLDITLPYDFFYPFLNNSEKMEVMNISIFLMISITLYNVI